MIASFSPAVAIALAGTKSGWTNACVVGPCDLVAETGGREDARDPRRTAPQIDPEDAGVERPHRRHLDVVELPQVRRQAVCGDWLRRSIAFGHSRLRHEPPEPSAHYKGCMHALKTAIAVVWLLFWIYWLASAFGVKRGAASRRRIPLTGVSAAAVVVLLRVFRGGSLEVHTLVLGAIGAALFAAGLLIAIWARVHLGRNWGMPMTLKAEPELVTSGPYAVVRHPIYSGLLLAILGTALATDILGLVIVAVLTGYFAYSASIEERNMTAAFPDAYPAYRARTKMLIPFVL